MPSQRCGISCAWRLCLGSRLRALDNEAWMASHTNHAALLFARTHLVDATRWLSVMCPARCFLFRVWYCTNGNTGNTIRPADPISDENTGLLTVAAASLPGKSKFLPLFVEEWRPDIDYEQVSSPFCWNLARTGPLKGRSCRGAYCGVALVSRPG